MISNHCDLTKLQSLLRFGILCKYYSCILQESAKETGRYLFVVPIKRQECAAVNTFPVKKQEINCLKQCSYTGSRHWKLLRKHYKRWINNPDSGEGITVLCKQRKQEESLTSQQLWAQSCCWDNKQWRIWPGSHSASPARNWEKWNTQVFVWTVSNSQKNPALETWLVPNMNWSFCVSWLWF